MKNKLAKILLFCFICNFAVIGNVLANTPNVASLSFAWPVPAALSVFKRGEYVWIVFDKKQVLDVDRVIKELDVYKPDVLEIPHSRATILRIKPQREVGVVVRKEGLLWIIDFIEAKVEPKKESLEAIVEVDGLDNPFVFVAGQTFVEAISVVDPDIGDYINVIPAVNADMGMHAVYRYVDFDFLYSIQGLAISPKTDDVYTIVGSKGVSVKSFNGGLHVSRGLDELKRMAKLMQRKGLGDAFDLSIPEDLLNKNFLDAEAMLKKDINLAKDKAKNIARIELAKYYIAKGLGFEAIGVIDNVLENKESDINSDAIYALRGIANFLAARYSDATKDFSYGNLIKDSQAEFWKKVCVAAVNASLFKGNLSDSFVMLKHYPAAVQVKLAKVIVRVALERRNELLTQSMIDILKLESDYNKTILPELNYLIAQNYYMQSYNKDAIKHFDMAINSQSQKYSALSRFDHALLSFMIKNKSIEDTIKELEKVKLAWGDVFFKKKVYNILVKLYQNNKDYANAIQTAFSELGFSLNEDKEEVKQRLISLFEDLYLNNLADDISAVKTLSIYRQYVDMIKLSLRYIDIVINVADRYFAVDLIESAQHLLEDEIDNERATLEQKYKMGTRLALIYIAQENLENAINVLDKTEIYDLEPRLKSYRNILRANVYKEQGDYEKAIDVLGDDASKLAILLRSEIYWLNGDWHELSIELKYLVDEPVEDVPLTEEQVKYLLDWLMALKKSGKDVIIARIRAKFEPWFKDSKYYSVFDVLTSQLDYDTVDIKDIEERINNMNAYSNFSQKIRENLSNIGKNEVK